MLSDTQNINTALKLAKRLESRYRNTTDQIKEELEERYQSLGITNDNYNKNKINDLEKLIKNLSEQLQSFKFNKEKIKNTRQRKCYKCNKI